MGICGVSGGADGGVGGWVGSVRTLHVRLDLCVSTDRHAAADVACIRRHE